MDEYPGNSHSERPPIRPEVTRSEEPRIERVTVNAVTPRKKSLGKRFVDSFAGGDDAQSVISYVILEVVVPATKDMIAEGASQFVEGLLFGDRRPSARRPGTRTGYTNYSQYSRSSTPRRDEPREVTKLSRARFDFAELVISTRVEAQQVLDAMYEALEKYRAISVADFYDLVGMSSQHTDNKWGWESLNSVRIIRVGGGYILDLPKPEPLR